MVLLTRPAYAGGLRGGLTQGLREKTDISLRGAYAELMRAYAGVLDPNLWKITRVFPVWTARCPNAVVSPFGPSICDRLGGLLSRLAAFLGPLGSLLGRPRALLSTARCPNVVISPFDRPSALVVAASWAVLRPFWALLDRSGAVLGPS